MIKRLCKEDPLGYRVSLKLVPFRPIWLALTDDLFLRAVTRSNGISQSGNSVRDICRIEANHKICSGSESERKTKKKKNTHTDSILIIWIYFTGKSSSKMSRNLTRIKGFYCAEQKLTLQYVQWNLPQNLRIVVLRCYLAECLIHFPLPFPDLSVMSIRS